MVGCCIKGCLNSSEKSDNKKISFYRLPTVHEGPDLQLRELTLQRRALWTERINRSDLHQGARVCSDHFVGGIPLAIIMCKRTTKM